MGIVRSEVNDVPSSSKTSMLLESTSNLLPKIDYDDDDDDDDDDAADDDDVDDELDPAMKEELDREVEDFARRLNSVWPERMQEILSLGQERMVSPLSMNGNHSLKRYTA